jgi:hypothetical protein
MLGEWKMCAKYTSQVLNVSSLLLSLPSIVNFGTRRKDVWIEGIMGKIFDARD